jgi:hypothetical protein
MANLTKTRKQRTWKPLQETANTGTADVLQPDAAPAPVASGGTAGGDTDPGPSPDREAIARLAYSYWEARGGNGGSPEDDWFRAERELRATR